MGNHQNAKLFYEEIGKKQYLNEETNTIEVRSETIGMILKFLRNRVGITQTTIARNIGIAQQTYAGYESGKHEPSIEIMIRLANFYNLSMDYITGRFIDDISSVMEEDINLDEILEGSAAFYESIEENNKNYISMIKEKAKK